jgi:hypothetical protein
MEFNNANPYRNFNQVVIRGKCRVVARYAFGASIRSIAAKWRRA